MKKILAISCMCCFLLIVLQGCKKDDTSNDSGTVTGSNYSIAAPSCLVTSVYFGGEESVYEYDGYKRLTHRSSNHDSDQTSYTYSGKIMTQTDNYISSSGGGTNTSVTIHTLNNMGMIEKSVSGDSLFRTEDYYYYDANGYLKRQIHKGISSSSTYYSGTSYAYENGNQTKSWDLTMDNNGQATDSTLSSTTTYYLDKPGKLMSWIAWIDRTGRANANEFKSEISSNNTTTYSYVDGPNGYPSTLTMSSNTGGGGTVNLTWKCD